MPLLCSITERLYLLYFGTTLMSPSLVMMLTAQWSQSAPGSWCFSLSGCVPVVSCRQCVASSGFSWRTSSPPHSSAEPEQQTNIWSSPVQPEWIIRQVLATQIHLPLRAAYLLNTITTCCGFYFTSGLSSTMTVFQICDSVLNSLTCRHNRPVKGAALRVRPAV